MSAFDDAFEGAFEYKGETHMLVAPSNVSELVAALRTLDMIDDAMNELLSDDDSSNLEYSKEMQEQYIQEYMEELGSYDNTCFKENLDYLLNKYNMCMGELEYVLDVSAGYISRTTGEDAKRRMSIDVLWKIAKVFHVDIEDLIEGSLEAPEGISESEQLVIDFSNTLAKKTRDGEMEWISEGKNMFEYMSTQKPDNPIFPEIAYYDDDENRWMKIYKYQSRFYSDEETEVSGNCYHAKYNGKRIYLNYVHYRMTEPEIAEREKKTPRYRQIYHEGIIEMYLTDKSNTDPICSTHFVRDEIKKAVKNLYETIESSHSRIGLTDNAKSFMKQLI